jgi:ComF family protein
MMNANAAARLAGAMASLRSKVPGRCVLCLAGDAHHGLCAACLADLPQLPAQCCPVCALPSPAGATCGACSTNAPDYDAVHAALPYAFPIDALVGALKYGDRLALAPVLGHLLAECVKVDPPPGAIVPMPLAPQRLRTRGFNQALELAGALPRRWLDRLVPNALERRRDTAPQASLALSDRGANVRDAFHARSRFDGLDVVVVDDVMTTGATLHEAAAALKRAGAARVRGWIVARTLLRE